MAIEIGVLKNGRFKREKFEKMEEGRTSLLCQTLKLLSPRGLLEKIWNSLDSKIGRSSQLLFSDEVNLPINFKRWNKDIPW